MNVLFLVCGAGGKSTIIMFDIIIIIIIMCAIMFDIVIRYSIILFQPTEKKTTHCRSPY